MDARQRFLEAMHSGKPERVPLFEEGIRSQVLRLWRRQGMQGDLSQLFHYDPYEETSPDLEPRLDLVKLAGRPDGLARLERSLDASDPTRLPPNWKKRVKAWRQRDHILILDIHEGFFLTLGVGDWSSFSQAIYLAADQPEFVRQVFRLQAEFAAQMAAHILAEVQVDAVLYSEPISGNHGPLISPRMYADLVLASLPPLMETLRRNGVDVFIYRTYANPRPLLAHVFQAGFNCLWACERPVRGMDYLELRAQLGPQVRLIGGIDVDVLRRDRAAIQRELERVVPPLLAQGGYLPLADGRVRENIPFENYAYYRQLLEEMVQTGA